jgi:hypothetical protein
MRKIALMLLLTIPLFSCEKQRQLPVENNDIPLLSKVLYDGVVSYEYTYNDANLLNEEKSKFHYTKHNYDENNLLTSSDFYWDPGIFSSSSIVADASMNRKEWVNPGNTAKSLTQTFEYEQSEQLARKTFTRTSSSNSEYAEFTYAEGRITRQTLFWQGVISSYIDYDYDDRGNLVKETRYGFLSDGVVELRTTTEYEFDNRHNPYLAFRRLMSPGICTNANNITRQTYTIHLEVDDYIEKVQVSSNTYEYNNSGYPKKVNGNIEYVYK